MPSTGRGPGATAYPPPCGLSACPSGHASQRVPQAALAAPSLARPRVLRAEAGDGSSTLALRGGLRT
eukprot:6367733-Pyramimonas_sp.AAC.1